MIENKRWVVTGAAGFLGSHLCDTLLEAGHDVLGVDALLWGQLANLSKARNQRSFEFVKTDIRDRTNLMATLQRFKPDHVIHLAALHFIPLAEREPDLALDINVRGTQNVIDAAQAAGAGHFFFASTGDVYPSSCQPHREDETPSPFNVYGVSKLHGELLCRLAAARSPATSFPLGRLFNLYGSRETNPHIIPEILKQLRENPHASLRLGSTWPRRDYTPVKDAAEAIFALSTQSAPGLEISNIGTGVARSVDELLAELRNLTDLTIPVILDPARVRPVERPHLQADVTRLRSRIGARVPCEDIKAGLLQLLSQEPITKAQDRTNHERAPGPTA